MTAGIVGPVDLEDADALVAADTDGLLRGAACAGAQVRATAAAVEEGVLAGLDRLVPRTVVLAAGRGPARAAAALVVELAAAASVPVVRAPVVPRWVGALDVVVVLADDPGDLELASSVARAADRGAELVLATPEDGPLAVAGGGHARRLPPRVRVPDGMGYPRFVAVVLATLGALGVLAPVDLVAVADALDADAVRDHPDRELFASPAKALAARLAGREVVLAGAGPGTTALAAHAAACLVRHAGHPVAAVDLTDVLAAGRRLDRSTGQEDLDPLFHDPELDGPLSGAPVRVVVVATGAERVAASLRTRVLRDSEVLVAAEDPDDLPPTVAAELLVLAARVETAAVYLGLAR